MNNAIFSTIDGLTPLTGPLINDDKFEIQRENDSFYTTIEQLADYVSTLQDLNQILQYVEDNLDLFQLGSYDTFIKEDGAMFEYSSSSDSIIVSPKSQAQILDNSTPVVIWDRTLGHNAEITIEQDTEVVMDNFVPGTYQITINQDSVGGHTFIMSSSTHNIKWANGVIPDISPAADATDTYTFLVPPSNLDVRGVPQFNFQ